MAEMRDSEATSDHLSTGDKPDSDRLIQDTRKYLADRIRCAAPDSVLAFAWEQFYATYSEVILRYARARRVPTEQLSDFAQDVWLAVVAEVPGLKYEPSTSGLRAWLWTVVRNKAAELVRRRTTRASERLVDADTLDATLHNRCTDPALHLEQQWEQELVGVILAKLRESSSEQSYRVLCMRVVEGRTVQEVAQTLNLTPAQVRARHHRLHKKFSALHKVYAGKDFG